MSDLTVEGSARGIDRIIVVSPRGARSEGLELISRVLPALGALDRLLRGAGDERERDRS
jgi:hypothetical protein